MKCNSQDYKYLSELNKLSAKVWNICLELSEKYRNENNGQWINRNELQKQTKSCVNLHAKGIHFVLHKYIYARDSAIKSRSKGLNNAYFPHRKKKYFNTGWDYQAIKVDYDRGIISLAKPKILRDGKMKQQKQVNCYCKNIPKNIVEIELIYRDKYYLAIKYKENGEYLLVKSNKSASIDLGEIHTITSIDSSGNAIIITGRKIRSIKYHRNKNLSKLFKKLSKCKKGSKRYKRIRYAIRRLKYKTKRRVNDCVHKITKLYLDFCIENNISFVYYGDLDSATRGTKQKNKGNYYVRQKLGQWNYGEVILQLENKLSRYGIKMIKIKEYYTSQKCPSCGELHKPKGRNYICKCGYEQHRDIVGAINILNDNSNCKITRYKSKKYLRIV